MARDESSREDLLSEAKQLVERIKIVPLQSAVGNWAHSSGGNSIVAGFRTDGAASIFFGEDPVYHFNAADELRRAYSQGLLIKADAGRLVSLDRQRSETEVRLVRHELSDAEQTLFLDAMIEHLQQLSMILAAGEFEIAGQVPADVDVRSRVARWLEGRAHWPIAARPNV
jgi:hypothetical protein